MKKVGQIGQIGQVGHVGPMSWPISAESLRFQTKATLVVIPTQGLVSVPRVSGSRQ